MYVYLRQGLQSVPCVGMADRLHIGVGPRAAWRVMMGMPPGWSAERIGMHAACMHSKGRLVFQRALFAASNPKLCRGCFDFVHTKHSVNDSKISRCMSMSDMEGFPGHLQRLHRGYAHRCIKLLLLCNAVLCSHVLLSGENQLIYIGSSLCLLFRLSALRHSRGNSHSAVKAVSHVTLHLLRAFMIAFSQTAATASEPVLAARTKSTAASSPHSLPQFSFDACFESTVCLRPYIQ